MKNQQIVNRLNQRNQNEIDNARIDEMEHYLRPLFILFVIVAACVIGNLL